MSNKSLEPLRQINFSVCMLPECYGDQWYSDHNQVKDICRCSTVSPWVKDKSIGHHFDNDLDSENWCENNVHVTQCDISWRLWVQGVLSGKGSCLKQNTELPKLQWHSKTTTYLKISWCRPEWSWQSMSGCRTCGRRLWTRWKDWDIEATCT